MKKPRPPAPPLPNFPELARQVAAYNDKTLAIARRQGKIGEWQEEVKSHLGLLHSDLDTASTMYRISGDDHIKSAYLDFAELILYLKKDFGIEDVKTLEDVKEVLSNYLQAKGIDPDDRSKLLTR